MAPARIPFTDVPIAVSDADWAFDLDFTDEDWTGAAVSAVFSRQGLPRHTFEITTPVGVLAPTEDMACALRIGFTAGDEPEDDSGPWVDAPPGDYSVEVRRIDGDVVDVAAVFEVRLYRGLTHLGPKDKPDMPVGGVSAGGVVIRGADRVRVVRSGAGPVGRSAWQQAVIDGYGGTAEQYAALPINAAANANAKAALAQAAATNADEKAGLAATATGTANTAAGAANTAAGNANDKATAAQAVVDAWGEILPDATAIHADAVAATGAAIQTAADLIAMDAKTTAMRVGAPGELLPDGTAVPPWAVVDRATGRILTYISAEGRLMTPRNGGSEVATLSDIAPALALGAAVTIVDSPVDQRGVPLGSSWYIVNRTTGHLLMWLDDATGQIMTGAGPVGGASSAVRDDRMLVTFNVTLGQLKVSVPSPKAGSTDWITYTWLKSTSALSLNFWQLSTVKKSVRVGTSFEVTEGDLLLGGGASGMGVWAEHKDGSGNSLDDGQPVATISPANFWGLPAHGGCYPIAFGPQDTTPAPILEVDGRRLDLTVNQALYGRAVRFQVASKCYRGRVPALNPAVDPPTLLRWEDYRVTAADQLTHRAEVEYKQQLTGSAYFPLLCITDIFETMQRDANGVERFNAPEQVDDSSVVQSGVVGVSRVAYSNAAGQSCEIVVGRPNIWAAGNRPWGALIPASKEAFQIKTEDAGMLKIYWSVGADFGTHNGIADTSRSYVGERWDRTYSLKFTV